MIIIVGFLAVALSVPLCGGRLSRLTAVPIRFSHLVVVAIMLQTALVSFPTAGLPGWLNEGLHLYTYLLAFIFLVANRHIPGLSLVTAGAVANTLPIVANGGVMPASRWATNVAGIDLGGSFANSAFVENARLLPLGDVFTIPAGWPFANVFSAGDVLLLMGASVLLHRVCGSRMSRRGALGAA